MCGMREINSKIIGMSLGRTGKHGRHCKKETGLGWDEVKKTYAMPREWWASFAQRNPGAEKFADKPPLLEDELDILFGGAAARGDKVFIPSSNSCGLDGISFTREENEIVADFLMGSDTFYEDKSTPRANPSAAPSQCSIGVETTSPHRPSPGSRACGNVKRARVRTGQKLEQSINRICDVIEMRTKLMCPSGLASTIPSIAEAMDLLATCDEIPLKSPLWSYAIILSKDPANREVFFKMVDNACRATWLAAEYDLIHRH